LTWGEKQKGESIEPRCIQYGKRVLLAQPFAYHEAMLIVHPFAWFWRHHAVAGKVKGTQSLVDGEETER
jgi:hypothetical protein